MSAAERYAKDRQLVWQICDAGSVALVDFLKDEMGGVIRITAAEIAEKSGGTCRLHYKELINELFLHLKANDFARLRTYRGEKSSLKTWMTTVIKHLGQDKLRRQLKENDFRKRLGELKEQIQQCSPQAIDTSPIASSELLRAIEKLDDQSKLVIGLKYFEGKSSSEIAELLNISEGNVNVIASRARAKLREWLNESRGADE